MIIDYSTGMQTQVEEFFKAVLEFRGWSFEPVGRHSILRDIPNSFQRERGGFWLYLKNFMLIGTVALKILDNQKNIAELKSMYVLPEYQGKGYGKELLSYALLKAKDLGYDYVRLDTTSDSIKAIKLYENTGFYKIEKYNENEVANVFMEFKLDDRRM